ncbi:undecaprenyl-diphosphatase [Allocatelliglobosispora scoriae]|uniref:Undecaprenyl-diphosphatase n=1 Tax=Allocatelliglobosispora scoriae TaxID=643052 RepID=A0A841BK09_9ACTN|nr:phosphatase PAP2 family protein [Allocatelliglobosispora scoriae]MBB5867509.1 undecaprenyl-diphosphatase [Allocatelliglobosispora scoriae]
MSRVNYDLFEVINGWAGHNVVLDRVAQFSATWLIYLVFAAAAVIGVSALLAGQIRALLLVGASLAAAFAAATVVSQLSHELRPFQTHHVVQLIAHGNGISMPSDHATAAFALAAAIGVFLHRTWGYVLAVMALVIGLSRVVAGVHYPGDILAALVIAIAATAAVWFGERVLRSRSADAPYPTADAHQ